MRIKFIIGIFVSIWLTLIVRVFILAVESNSYYTELSHNNTVRTETIIPIRSEILDRNLRPIAINELGFKIQLKPHLTSKKNRHILNEELDNLVKLLPSLSKKKLLKNYKKKESFYNHNYIDIVHFVTYKEIMPLYSILNLRENIKLLPAPKRFYPYKEVGAHLLGYVARANKKDVQKDKLLGLIGYKGKTGVERKYNSYLQGDVGKRKIKVNANNQEIEELSLVQAKEDRKLILNIDMEIQKYISEIFKGKVGAVTVMNVNGAILAAGSFPEYNLNNFVSGMSHEMYNKLSSSLDHPFTNKLIHGLYPPGSTIKTGLGLIYITTDLNEHWGVNCKSHLPLGKRIFRCWRRWGHGMTGLNKAIRESCDDYFYKGALEVGIKKMSDGFKRYGLGTKTGIDLPNEWVGIVPSREWKRKKYNKSWYKGETLNTSIGQGSFLTTPMQIARYTALMATGKLPIPHIAKIIDEKPYNPQPLEILSKLELEKLPLIQKAMYEVCNHKKGTATKYVDTNITIAGKTGTAQVVAIKQDVKKRIKEHNMDYYNRSHAWFTTYGPYDNPQYVVSVLVEHGGHGGSAAGEVVSKIYNKLLELGYIKESKEESSE